MRMMNQWQVFDIFVCNVQIWFSPAKKTISVEHLHIMWRITAALVVDHLAAFLVNWQ